MEKKIGTNKSSGAEKVDTIEKRVSADPLPPSEKKKSKPSASKKPSSGKQAHTRAVEKEKRAAAERTKAAKKRAEKKAEKREKKLAYKEKKLERKAALKEKKLARRAMISKKRAERKQKRLEKRAALKEKKSALRAERIARREMLKNESKTEKSRRLAREKREANALKRKKREAKDAARENRRKAREAAHARRAADKKHRREQRTARKANRKGFGGWLAAVISLGVACLALGTVVTAGALRLNEMQLSSESGYRATLFEMVSVSDDMENDLNKLRVSSGVDEQRRLLTDLLVESALMESALERIPVDAATGTDISAFVNRTNAFAREMLSRLASGKTLTSNEKEALEEMHAVNAVLSGELNTLATTMTEKDLRAFLGGKEGSVSERFGSMGEETKEISDAPFSDEGNVGSNSLAGEEEISSERAEELAKKYFSDYHIANTVSAGETAAPDMVCYNFVLTDENGAEYFAEITKRGGKLAYFGTYEECHTKNFDLPTCDAIAREYLQGIGIENTEAVWLSDGGMVADLTYVTVKNGVRVYPEIVRVRVCEEKGRVIGMDARGYLVNRTERSLKPQISSEEAEGLLSENLTVKSSRLAVIPVNGTETLCYEFDCTYGEEEYLVYLDAVTGAETELLRVRRSARGNYLD